MHIEGNHLHPMMYPRSLANKNGKKKGGQGKEKCGSKIICFALFKV